MKRPIRVLQVFAGMNRGGAETMIMNVYRKIDRNRIQFDFIVHTEEECSFDEEITMLGGRIYRLPKYTGKNHFIYKKAWRNFFEKYPDYKIVHGHVRSTASIYLDVARDKGLITIAHSHSTASRGSVISKIAKKTLQYNIKFKADYLLACSREAGEWLYGRKAVEESNFKIIYNTIDVEKFEFNEEKRKKTRQELGITNEVVFGHVGSFTPPKNHKFLIEIFKSIVDSEKDSILLLVGDGELKETIEKQVKGMNLEEKVIFTGIRTDISELLQAMDIFVFPSIFEGIPVTLIEAQASGIKSYISKSISPEVKITGEVEFISITDSSKEWGKKILSNLGKYDRENKTKQIVEAGYDVKGSTKWLENFYFKIIDRKI